MFIYEINGKKYIQKPLVLGQISQIMKLCEGLLVPQNVDALGLVAALGDRLPQAIAIVITPEGMNLKDKDIASIAKDIEFELSPDLAIQVIEDFFSCNPIASLLERLSGTAEKIAKQISKETSLKKSFVSSLEETSPKETASSGDTPSGNASLT